MSLRIEHAVLRGDVACAHEGCETRIPLDRERMCKGCLLHYCPEHLHQQTWYGGDVVSVCSDCVAGDAEPVQY